MDLALAKAEPIRHGGNTSGINDKTGKEVTAQQQLQLEREVAVLGIQVALQGSRSVQEGQELLQAPEQRFPCSL